MKGENIMSLYGDLKAADIPMASHYSDLYFPDTPQTREILARYPLQKSNASGFINQAPPNVGQVWIDVPFAFEPWWQSRTIRCV